MLEILLPPELVDGRGGDLSDKCDQVINYCPGLIERRKIMKINCNFVKSIQNGGWLKFKTPVQIYFYMTQQFVTKKIIYSMYY